MLLKILILANLHFAKSHAYKDRDNKDAKEQKEYNPLGALVRLAKFNYFHN